VASTAAPSAGGNQAQLTIGHYVFGKSYTFQSQEIKTVNNMHIPIGKSLGKGTFGKVKQATHTLTGEKVAVKILEKDKIKDKKDVERITREIKILKKVRHPNVIQLYEVRKKL
jgi:5'-AMP-activated protein kinase catalytic alpha subunit